MAIPKHFRDTQTKKFLEKANINGNHTYIPLLCGHRYGYYFKKCGSRTKDYMEFIIKIPFSKGLNITIVSDHG